MNQFVRRFEPLAAICQAIADGDVKKATSIIDEQGPGGLEGISGDTLAESPVLMALSTGHPRLARRIIASGYKPSAWEAAGLDLAGELHALAAVDPDRLCLCNAEGWAPLHLACYAHAYRALVVLCEFATDPNVVACNSSLETPLHSAVRADDAEAVRILLEAGADPRFLDAAGRSPLQLAIELAAIGAGEMLMRRDD
ncbi:MAG: ankyrin repeat domain-containing protein [Phycisphaerales bacterium]|nr:ankyrin repeat domain-containing protein [Phycisphaerales bacterium]MCB9835831.1 ankyrin repeat domain-containing protein [Phycisphaera sp.]